MHLPEIRVRTSGETCLGAYLSGGSDGLVEFTAGRPAQDRIDVPPGLTVRELPAATYAVFECTMADIGATWHAIYGDWLPASDYLTDDGKACLEEFAPGCHEGRTPVRILVPSCDEARYVRFGVGRKPLELPCDGGLQ